MLFRLRGLRLAPPAVGLLPLHGSGVARSQIQGAVEGVHGAAMHDVKTTHSVVGASCGRQRNLKLKRFELLISTNWRHHTQGQYRTPSHARVEQNAGSADHARRVRVVVGVQQLRASQRACQERASHRTRGGSKRECLGADVDDEAAEAMPALVPPHPLSVPGLADHSESLRQSPLAGTVSRR
eukprot:3935281-Rhodomonas_salina.1